jgi:hypothetical protein
MAEGDGRGQAVRVKVLFAEGCASAPATVERIRETARGLGVEIALEEVLVSTEEEAVAQGFLGSPTVQVNGLDLEPSMREEMNVGFV